MKYPRMLLISLLALAALLGALAVSASGGKNGPEPPSAGVSMPAPGPGFIAALAARQGGRNGSLQERAIPTTGDKNPKLSSHVARLTQAEREAAAGGEAIATFQLSSLEPDLQAMIDARLMRIDGQGRLQVYVHIATTVDEVVADVGLVEGLVERFDDGVGIVQAQVPINQLERLAAQPSVKFIRLPDYGFPQAGSVTSEGDSILRADLVRTNLGLTGAGVRIGVISNGVTGLADSQASGDLPAVDITTCNVIPGSDPTLSGAEGMAMLEVVHDVAPGAELWFGHFWTGGTSLDFNAAVDCLAANVDVVVDDIGWLNNGLYDGSSDVSTNTSTELNRPSNRIRAHITTVGNMARQHYEEPFTPCGDTTFHQFSATADTLDLGGLGSKCRNPLVVPAGATAKVFLQWDDPWGTSCNDYDLYLYTFEGGSLLAFSTSPQTCSQPPTEYLVWRNPLQVDVMVDLVINNPLGHAAPRKFDLFTVESYPNFVTPGGSVTNQSDAGGGVIAVGAINASDPGHDTIAYYSSRGPTNDGRIKPDITGIDGVSISGAGGFSSPFFGTSAAAPHIAGIAALLLECRPDLKAGELGDNPAADRGALGGALLDGAVDLGPAGVDNTYGSGRADALASANILCLHSTPTPTPTAIAKGDMDCDGKIDAVDALLILRHVVALPVNLPPGCTAIGSFPTPTPTPTPTPALTPTPTPPP